jgi:hypothetical protein
MKLKILTLAAGIVMLAACSTTTYKATDQSVVFTVPAETQTSFTRQYPMATNIVWSSFDQVAVPIDWDLTEWPAMEANDYVVQFDLDNEKYYAWYDADGSWIGTAYVVNDYKSLPSPVTDVLNSQFSGYSVTSVNKEFRNDRIAYEVELKNETSKVKLLVDGNGTIIKQKTKTQ